MDDFESIIGSNFGEGDATPAHVFEYATLPVADDAPEAIAPKRRNRQWALVAPDGTIAAVGPATGGMKSRFIAFAASPEGQGYRVAHRWVESGEWKVPTD